MSGKAKDRISRLQEDGYERKKVGQSTVYTRPAPKVRPKNSRK